MATTTVNVSYEGIVERLDTSSSAINWLTTTRNASTGTSATTYNSIAKSALSPRSYYELAKGTYSSANVRTFFFFDLSSVGGTITAATLKVYNDGSAISDDIECVEATAWGGSGSSSTLATTDYDEVALLGSGDSYSNLLTWAGSAYNSFTLNSTAISDMNTNGYLNCALLTQDLDYRGIAPSLGTNVGFQIRFNDSSNPVYLDITYTPAYNNTVNGVSASNIGNVNAVAKANIANVNGV
jgi:hypothetical protein